MEKYSSMENQCMACSKLLNSPQDVEEIILHHPAVANAVVIGVHDPESGDRLPGALVVLKEGVAESPEVIKEFAENRLASNERIHGGLYIVPRLPSHKTQRPLKAQNRRSEPDLVNMALAPPAA